MTVKVVSDKPVRTKRVTCPNCCYELEFTGEDVISYVDSDGDSHQHIFCPRLTCKPTYQSLLGSVTKISVKWP